MEEFLQLLFDQGQQTCFSKDCLNTNLASYPKTDDLFFSINAMQDKRKDANVTCHRNFLIEIDTLPLLEQFDYVKSKLPVSSVVYSGGKSYHFVISLAESVSAEDYRTIVERIHLLLPDADPSCRNPSRFSRLPDRYRPETGQKQTLLELNSRIDNTKLLALLPELPKLEEAPKTKTKTKDWIAADLNFALNNPDEFIAERGLAGRNLFFYYLYNRLEETGKTRTEIKEMVEYAYANLKNKSDFPITEAYTAARIWG